MIRRRFLALTAFGLSPAARAIAQSLTNRPGGSSLAGQLLVATAAAGDPRFDRAVILIVRDEPEGAFGVMINRPLGERPWTQLLSALGRRDVKASGNVRIFLGGPVGPEIAFMIHGRDYHRPETHDLGDDLAMTSSPEALLDLATGKGPEKSLVAFGYAGWAPGQLEAERKENAWDTAPADAGLVLSDDRDTVWERAKARRTQDL